MASTAIEGFVTGFSNTLAQGIQERNREARDFFNKQVEYARTTGLQNRQRVRQQADAQTAIAQQLKQVGIPDEVIMQSVASGQDLDSLYKSVETIRAETESKPNAVRMTPEAWQEVFDLSENYKAPDEDVASFIRRHYAPISQATTDPLFEDDPRGSLMSRIMGFGRMDSARRELETTVIADGMTAQDLINYGDYQPPVDPNASVTLNYTALQDRGGDRLTAQQAVSLDEFAQNTVDRSVFGIQSQYAKDNPGQTLAEGQLPPGMRVDDLRQQILEDLKSQNLEYSEETLNQYITNSLLDRGYSFQTEEPEAPVADAVQPPPANETLAPAYELDLPGETSYPEYYTTSDGFNLTLKSVEDDGTLVYIDQYGDDHRISSDKFK